jgi:hypothetical protein
MVMSSTSKVIAGVTGSPPSNVMTVPAIEHGAIRPCDGAAAGHRPDYGFDALSINPPGIRVATFCFANWKGFEQGQIRP